MYLIEIIQGLVCVCAAMYCVLEAVPLVYLIKIIQGLVWVCAALYCVLEAGLWCI